jgi:putative ABC transport system ATP-binding protein
MTKSNNEVKKESKKETSKLLLELEKVTKKYIIGDETIKAVDEISLSINEGEFLAILGASGSGKSTLLSLISGIECPSEGKIHFNEKTITDLNDDELADMRREEVGIIFQSFHLKNTLTARENVELPLLIAGVHPKERMERALAQLEVVGLNQRKDHLPHELSGGEKQLVCIARAVVISPIILLADEPTGNLDSVSGDAIIDLLVSLNKKQKLTVIMVTHDEEAIRDGMKILSMEDGKIKKH